jgi:hypothetical protein
MQLLCGRDTNASLGKQDLTAGQVTEAGYNSDKPLAAPVGGARTLSRTERCLASSRNYQPLAFDYYLDRTAQWIRRMISK